MDVQKHSVHTLVFRSLKRTHDMFVSDHAKSIPLDEQSHHMKMGVKLKTEYEAVLHMPVLKEGKDRVPQLSSSLQGHQTYTQAGDEHMNSAWHSPPNINVIRGMISSLMEGGGTRNSALSRRAPTMPKPQWHPPWKLFRVISGHLGWVRSIAVEPGNQWFVTGSADRTIKIWDLASGKLKLSLTGHISTVRGVAVSNRSPYLFSCGEDKQVKCWDLEYNKVIRHYHGHLSAVYDLDLHPTIDVLMTCSRDATARVWDIRTKANVHTLTGHTNTVATVRCQAAEPQVVTGSHDSTIRLWDLVAGKTRATLTNHKKSVRTLALHPRQYTFASGSADNIKQWMFPDGNFIQNLSGHNAIINTLAVNSDGVLVSGADNGTIHMWDWRTGYNFQRIHAAVQPGSLDSESGIFACVFDHSESRLITAEADKTIKVYKEDDTAVSLTLMLKDPCVFVNIMLMCYLILVF
uniref:Pleiotropic regulator 1 n=1 Tax=Sphaeramia orbicularis TaxID=375764 RepID=A0A672YSW4_9TELE